MQSKADHKRSYANRLGFIAEHGGAPAKPANTTLPMITGTAEVEGTLEYAPGVWTGRPPPDVTAVWLRNGVVVGPAAEDLEVTEDDIGVKFRVREAARNIVGNTTVQSSETAEVPDPDAE